MVYAVGRQMVLSTFFLNDDCQFPIHLIHHPENWMAAFLTSATGFRLDASNQMPEEGGAGAFWTGMVQYVAGDKDLQTVLQEIDAAWPR